MYVSLHVKQTVFLVILLTSVQLESTTRQGHAFLKRKNGTDVQCTTLNYVLHTYQTNDLPVIYHYVKLICKCLSVA